MKHYFVVLWAIILILLLVGCRRAPTAQPATATPVPPTATSTPEWLARLNRRLTRTANAVATLNARGDSASTGTLESTPLPPGTLTPPLQSITPSASLTTNPQNPVAPPFAPTSTQPPGGIQFPTATISQPAASATPQPTGSVTPTQGLPAPAQGLTGTWQQDLTSKTAQFRTDGTYRLAGSFQELKTDALDDGSYQVQGDQLNLISSPSSASCRNTTGTYRYQIPSSTQRQFSMVQDICYDRWSLLPQKTWYWLPVPVDATPAVTTAIEQVVTYIPLQDPLSRPEARITGMAWYNQYLFMLPYDPGFAGESSQALYVLDRTDVAGFLNGYFSGPLGLQRIPFNDSGLSTSLAGFQGYQAIAIKGEKVYLIVQADPGGGPRSYLVSANIAAGLASVTVDAARLVEIPAQASSLSRLYRSLLVTSDAILAFPDLTGSTVNTSPTAQRYDLNLAPLSSLPLAGIDYMLTDVAGPEANGQLWAVNKYAPGDAGAISGPDVLAQLYGQGVTHQVFDRVERLVPFQLSANSITLAAKAPVQLELAARGGRNWQGIALFSDQGFLIISDGAPGAFLGFVERP